MQTAATIRAASVRRRGRAAADGSGGSIPVARAKWRCLIAALVARNASMRPMRTSSAYAREGFVLTPMATGLLNT